MLIKCNLKSRTYLPRGCPESTKKIGNVGEYSDYRVSIRQVPTGRKRRKKGLAYSRSQ